MTKPNLFMLIGDFLRKEFPAFDWIEQYRAINSDAWGARGIGAVILFKAHISGHGYLNDMWDRILVRQEGEHGSGPNGACCTDYNVYAKEPYAGEKVGVSPESPEFFNELRQCVNNAIEGVKKSHNHATTN